MGTFFFRPEGMFCWCQASLLQDGLLPWAVQPRELPGSTPGLWERGWCPSQPWEWSRTEVDRKHAAKPVKARNRDFRWGFLDRALEKWRGAHVWCLPRSLPVVWWKQFPVPVSRDPEKPGVLWGTGRGQRTKRSFLLPVEDVRTEQGKSLRHVPATLYLQKLVYWWAFLRKWKVCCDVSSANSQPRPWRSLPLPVEWWQMQYEAQLHLQVWTRWGAV